MSEERQSLPQRTTAGSDRVVRPGDRSDSARLQAMLDAAVDVIVVIDEFGVIESVNRVVERLFGYTQEELIGKNVKVLMPPPYHGEHDGYLANYRESGEAKIIGIGREVVARRKEGTTFPIDLSVSEVVEEDGRRSFLGIIRDATERHLAQTALQRERDFAEHLLETAHAIVLVLDPRGRIVRYNHYLEALSGRPLEATRDADWFETFIPGGYRAEVREVFERAVNGSPTIGHLNPISTADGNLRQIEWYSSTLLDPDGSTLGVLAVGLDVTERTRLEEQFRQMQKMEAVGRLAGGIAHDFNTLLGSITGYSDMLLERLEGSALRRSAEQIHRCADRGASLTRQLLAFSRQQVVRPQQVDVALLIADMRDMLDRLAGDDVALDLDLGGGKACIEADPGQVEQVVMNLVVNAVDAMPRGGEIRIRLDRIEVDDLCPCCRSAHGPGVYVRVRVSDSGVGIDPLILDRLFEPFFTTKEPGKGTGLGLSTVYGIVKQAGGCVSVESEVGAGTTFFVILPEMEAAQPTGDRAESAWTGTATDLGGTETVLVVEDDEIFRELISEMLAAQGYDVLVAEGPEAALEQIKAGTATIDLLVSDVVMPGMTGTELAAQLTAWMPRLRVLLMSGYNDEDLALRGADTEGSAYVQKPFETGDFLRLVRNLLDG